MNRAEKADTLAALPGLLQGTTKREGRMSEVENDIPQGPEQLKAASEAHSQELEQLEAATEVLPQERAPVSETEKEIISKLLEHLKAGDETLPPELLEQLRITNEEFYQGIADLSQGLVRQLETVDQAFPQWRERLGNTIVALAQGYERMQKDAAVIDAHCQNAVQMIEYASNLPPKGLKLLEPAESKDTRIQYNVPPSIFAGKSPEDAVKALNEAGITNRIVIAGVLDKMGCGKLEGGRLLYVRQREKGVGKEAENSTYINQFSSLLKDRNRLYSLTFKEGNTGLSQP